MGGRGTKKSVQKNSSEEANGIMPVTYNDSSELFTSVRNAACPSVNHRAGQERQAFLLDSFSRVNRPT